MRERDIEKYLVDQVRALGGEVRKVKWVGRNYAPDRLVMGVCCYARLWPGDDGVYSSHVWVELKNPDTIKTFPANAHERAQKREHDRMRDLGQRVVVIGTREQVDELLR